jgi:hypothetical protein
MAFIFRPGVHFFVAGFVGLLLMFLFMQLFTMAVSLAASAVGARLFSAGRRVAFVAVVAAVALVVWQSGIQPARGDWRGFLEATEKTPAYQYASAPLRWFILAFTADSPLNLALYGGLALLVDLALLGVVVAVDAQYQEASAAASARLFARIQRMRRGGPFASVPAGGKAGFSLPMPPWLGGVGPIFWRQLTGALRDRNRLIMLALIFGVALTAPAFLIGRDPEAAGALLPALGGGLFFMSVLMTTLVPFDFRGDVDHIATLKSLPIPAWRLALGQLLTPVLLYTLVQWAALAVLQAALGRPEPWLLAAAAFALPFNYLLFGVENLMFLLFPVRLLVATPGDFQAMGRNVLMQVAKGGSLLTAGCVAAGFALLAYLLTGGRLEGVNGGDLTLTGGNFWLATAAGWVPTATAAFALTPLIGLAFQRFDVSRETPQ